jgi:enoyl-CoA hydratase/carnithine racemase
MSSIHVYSRVDNHIGQLVLSNPGKFNALPQSAWFNIRPTITDIVRRGARVVVISGEAGNFCAGADISEFDVVRKDPDTAQIYEASNVEAFAAIRDCPVPTIAKIEGCCLGGGFGLAAACDMRVAARKSTFAVPAAKLGLGYPVEAMADIVSAIGDQNTKRMLFTAAQFTSENMLDMGFLMRLVTAEELHDGVDTLAQTIAQLAPLTHQATISSIRALHTGDAERAKVVSDVTFTSQDYEEGRQAFREKRKPQFTGN